MGSSLSSEADAIDPDHDLSHRLCKRLARGRTQAQLGSSPRLHRTFIGSVQQGERNLSILNPRQISRVLRGPLAELFADPPGAGRDT